MKKHLSAFFCLAAAALTLSGCFYAPRHDDGYARDHDDRPIGYDHPHPEYAPPPTEYREPAPGVGANISIHG
jgi:hypothetical protein